MILLMLSNWENTTIYSLIGVAIIVILIAVILIVKSRRLMVEYGSVPQNKQTNFSIVFLITLVIAVVIIYLLKIGLEANVGMLNYILFSVFPYMAFSIFLIGSIFRYRSRSFGVSSLSSEFLERKKLFWGSQPFHWGLLVLFFGHLIAFLFPSAILAWNGEPVRLLILEVSAFVFGLSALLGLILLVKRRLNSSMVRIVTNKMDMIVYTTLFVQIISGLGVAYFDRWGSSWFASAVTPYLVSLFAFNPDIAAVSAFPWLVQIHIFSAFFIVAIIPFSRFMHFLVAPIDYLWRDYQLVIWNWSRKSIRNSTAYFFGKKPRNQ